MEGFSGEGGSGSRRNWSKDPDVGPESWRKEPAGAPEGTSTGLRWLPFDQNGDSWFSLFHGDIRTNQESRSPRKKRFGR